MPSSKRNKKPSHALTHNEKIGLLADDFLLIYPNASKSDIVKALHSFGDELIDLLFRDVYQKLSSLSP
ncbi:MAG: hypothetical protein ACRD36_12215, partial [Candidatus Acidiferrum sp.]